jgi:glycine cleavage system H protein
MEPSRDDPTATMSIPGNLRYSADHEWISVDGDTATVGITQYAATALGDIVFVEIPETGARLRAGQACGEVESTKSVSELTSPAAGEVIEANTALADAAHLLNHDPYGEGWLFRLRLDGPIEGLLDADQYRALTGES